MFILNRVLWLDGVRLMLGPDASYLVVESFDEDGADFAKSLDIDVMTIGQLRLGEKHMASLKTVGRIEVTYRFSKPPKTNVDGHWEAEWGVRHRQVRLPGNSIRGNRFVERIRIPTS